jgi:glutamate--cysteine ligase
MSVDREFAASEPVRSIEDLVAGFRAAEKPAARHRLGIEHEKLVHRASDAAPAAYGGDDGIDALLAELAALGYEPASEGQPPRVVALRRGQSTVSLEPGGQLEFSGSPFVSAREAYRENLEHLGHLRTVTSKLGLMAVALAYRPFDALEAVPWMPRARFDLMQHSLPQYGALGSNMMRMTASVQVSLDWADEADCARKVQVMSRMTPLLVAMFANSPLEEGQPTGYVSYRSRIWDGVDGSRCGYLPSMLDGTFSYATYVDWALDANVLFVRRGDVYRDPRRTFRKLLAEGWDGEPVTFGDWDNHVSTLFPEVRIKRVLEVRGPDGVDASMVGALAALLRGLLYDDGALRDANALLPMLSLDEQRSFHDEARRHGMRGRLGKAPLSSVALDTLDLARDGLGRLDPDDIALLEPLYELAESSRCPADRVLDAFRRGAPPAELLAQFVV